MKCLLGVVRGRAEDGRPLLVLLLDLALELLEPALGLLGGRSFGVAPRHRAASVEQRVQVERPA